jgi:predicted nucleic acid-binding protein
VLIDSNIFIYAILPEHENLRKRLQEQWICASDITRLEVLGYHLLGKDDRADLLLLFEIADVISVSSSIIDLAIRLRQNRKMSVGDAVVAATALECGESLMTRNVKDFVFVEGLTVVDPFAV